MEHITICICTYKRQKQLKRLLTKISQQKTEGLFTFSAVVVDNDENNSAKTVLEEMQNSLPLEIVKTHVVEKNFAVLRNTSLQFAKGDFVAFIDDDEYPITEWLLLLYKAIKFYQSSGALGPVIPSYLVDPPQWIIKGNFNQRKQFNTGKELTWKNTRTGNALLKRELFMDKENLFDIKFKLGSEDDNMFKNLIEKGYTFTWCDEAIVYEEVPGERLKVSYYLKRSKLFGYISYDYYKDSRTGFDNFMAMIKSSVKLLIYSILILIIVLFGFHRFVYVLIRFTYHLSVIRSFFGLIKFDERNI